MHKINAHRPAAARKPLHHFGIFELLGHGGHQWTQTSQHKAKNTCRTKLPVTGHDIRPHEWPRGHARWLEAHRVRTPRPRHAMSLPAAHRHVWEVSPRRLASIGARVHDASDDLSRLEQSTRSVTRQASPMTCAVETLETQPIRVSPGCGHEACKVSDHADHL